MDINSDVGGGLISKIYWISLKAYNEGFLNMNHPKYHTIINTIEEDRVTLWDIIDHYNWK